MDIREFRDFANKVLSHIGYEADCYVVDDVSIFFDGITIYSEKLDNGDIGWGSMAEELDYDDYPHVIDIALPYEERKSIKGTVVFGRTFENALKSSILCLIENRLNNFIDFNCSLIN